MILWRFVFASWKCENRIQELNKTSRTKESNKTSKNLIQELNEISKIQIQELQLNRIHSLKFH